MRRGAIGVVTTLALAYGGICAFMFVAQRTLLYYPVPARAPGTPSLALPSDGETLRIWSRPASGPRALVYFGGNGEDVSTSLGDFAAVLPGHALYFASYRGYGGSTGSPSEQALFADALAVHDHVSRAHAEVTVVGRSLGSGVAVYLAQQRPVARLVLVTPFDSIENVAAGVYPFLPVRLLLRDKFDSASRVAGVRAPTLVIVAERDEVIPRARTDALVARFARGQARVELIPGATHNALDYESLLPAFLGG